MTVNLGEHQVGFDAHELGFPSIDACMAIVVVCPNGLYGYHSYGGETVGAWADRGPAFRQFITGHGGDPTQATRLYGVTHVTSKRGWGGGVRKQLWLAELQAYAGYLGTQCRISGYNLDDAIAGGFHKKTCSAYVRFNKAGTKCNVAVQSWDSVTYTKLTAANNPWGNDIKAIKKTGGGTAVSAVFGDIYDPINPTTALKQISKSKLAS